MTEENLQFVSHSVFASPDNKVLTNDPGQQDSALPKVFKLVFVYVYTVIRARAVRNSLDKTLNAEEFLFLSCRNYLFMRNRIYAYL